MSAETQDIRTGWGPAARGRQRFSEANGSHPPAFTFLANHRGTDDLLRHVPEDLLVSLVRTGQIFPRVEEFPALIYNGFCFEQ